MELEFVTLAEDPVALERLPAEQGLTGGCDYSSCLSGWTCGTTCVVGYSCLNHQTCELYESAVIPG